MKCYTSLLFGLFVIWTGLLRCIEAGAFKPNAFWFCLTTGMMAIAAAFLFRVNREQSATVVGAITGTVVLAFYLYCFTDQPEKDATIRVGLAIVAAIGHLSIILMPSPTHTPKEC